MKKVLSKRILVVIVLILIISSSLVFSNVYINSKKPNAQWLVYQDKFIQYLYYAVQCTDMAEKNEIKIDNFYKGDLRNYTKKLFDKVNIKNLKSIQLVQLIWLNNYYKLDKAKQLTNELNKFYDRDKNIFYSDLTNPNETEENAIGNSCQIYNIIKGIEISNYNLLNGFSDYCKENKSVDSSNYGELLAVVNVLIQSKHENLFDKDKVYEKLNKAMNNDNDNALRNGTYIINLNNISAAKQLSDFYIYFKNDTTYENLNQEIYNKIQSVDLAGYDSKDVLFNLFFFVSVQDVKDLKENSFISSNLNAWLIENYNTSIKSDFEKAFSE